MTRISAHLRQECNRIDWDSMFYSLVNAGLSDLDCARVKEAFDRCMREVDFIPNSKAVLARLPESVTENKKPDLEFIRDYYRPYSATLREHVFEYEGGYRQVKLGKIA